MVSRTDGPARKNERRFSEKPSDSENKVLQSVFNEKTPITRRRALSNIGKAAIGVAVVAVAGGIAYYATQSSPTTQPTSSSSQSSSMSSTAPAPASSSSVTPVQMTMMIQSGGGQGIPGTWIANTWNSLAIADRAGVQINTVGYPWEQMEEKWLAEATAKSTTYGIEQWNGNWEGGVAPFLTDLTPFVQEHGTDLSVLNPGMLKQGQWHGQLLGFPWRGGCEDVLVHRVDLFQQAGVEPPTNLQEYLAVARKLNNPPDHYGCSLILGGYQATDYEFERWFWALGGRYVNEDQSAMASQATNGPLAVKIIDTWKTLLQEHLVPTGATSFTFSDNLTAYMQGTVAMYIEFVARAQVIENPSQSKVSGKNEWTLFFPNSSDAIGPRGDYGGPWLVGVNPNLDHDSQEKVYKICEYFISHDIQLGAALNHANTPSRNDVLANLDYQKAVISAKAGAQALNTLYNVVIPQRVPIDQIIAAEIDAALAGKQSSQDAVNNIWTKSEKLFNA